MLATVISVTYEIDITGQPRKMGLDADRGGVMDGVHDKNYEEKQAEANKVLIDHTEAEKEAKVEEIKKKHPKTIVFYVSANMTLKIPSMIFKAIEADHEKAMLDDRDPYKKIIIAVHFAKSKTARDEWRKTGGWKDQLLNQWGLLETKYSLDNREFALEKDDIKIAV